MFRSFFVLHSQQQFQHQHHSLVHIINNIQNWVSNPTCFTASFIHLTYTINSLEHFYPLITTVTFFTPLVTIKIRQLVGCGSELLKGNSSSYTYMKKVSNLHSPNIITFCNYMYTLGSIFYPSQQRLSYRPL